MRKVFTVKAITVAIPMLMGTSVLAMEKQPTQAIAPAAIAADAPSKATADNKTAAKPASAKEKEGGTAPALSIAMRVPLFNPAFASVPVASVNGEYITLEQLQGAIVLMHEGKQEQKTPLRKNYTEILNRLLNVRLMVQEAGHIELDQLPEVKKLVEEYEQAALKQLLVNQVLQEVKADANEVEKTYRDNVRQWKIKSIFFKNQDDAKKIEQELKAGKHIDAQLEKLTKDGLAKGRMEAVYLSGQKAQPQIVLALEKMKAGSVSPVIPLDAGFTVLMLEEDVRVRENPEEREQARQAVLQQAQKKALADFRRALIKKYVKMQEKVLARLDFEAPKPGFKKLLDDKRTLAEITGEKPVTVADLAAAVQEKFFHGTDLAIREKKINPLKAELLEQILVQRLFLKEILLRGIDKTDEYRKLIKEYKDTASFGIFVENLIRPEVRVSEDEAKGYYREHIEEYSFPELIKLAGLAFPTTEAAQACVGKMRQGADLKWLKETAEAQVKAGDPRLLNFAGNLVTTTNMPAELRKALTGARSEEFRLYADPGGHYYALAIQEVVPARAMPYEDAKQNIIQSLYEKNLQKAIDGWVKKLRAASDIKVYAVLGDADREETVQP